MGVNHAKVELCGPMLRIRHVSNESPVTSHSPSHIHTYVLRKMEKNQHARVLRSNDLISTGPSNCVHFNYIHFISRQSLRLRSRKEEASCRGPCVNKSNDVN